MGKLGAWLFGALAVVLAGAAGTGGAVARPLDKALASGTLAIAVYLDFPPWSYEEKGELVGIDVDLGRELAQELHVTPAFLPRMAGEDVEADLRANVWRGDIVTKARADVMMHIPVDPDLAARNDMVVICCAYHQERMAVAFDPAVITARTYGTFRTHKIAVEGGGTADIWLSAAFNGQLAGNVLRSRRFEEAVGHFGSGQAPALMATRAQVEWAVARSGRTATIEEWPMFGIISSSWPVGLATRVDAHDLAYALEDAIGAIRASGRMEAIYRRYGVSLQKPVE